MATTPVATETGAFIAEFGGKLYLSMHHASYDKERLCEDFVDRVVVVDTRWTISCSCGASFEWSSSPSEDSVVAYRYFRPLEEAGGYCHLTVVRSAKSEPLCDHWLELPLSLKP
jgi:hypothetical protein